MLFKRIRILGLLIFSANCVYAQSIVWNDLMITMPDGWSTTKKNGTLHYSNYNLKPEHPQSCTLFPSKPFKGRPDSLFAFAWRMLVENNPSQQETPRWRRYYTGEGKLIQQGGMESNEIGNTLYRMLSVYVLDSTFQACLLETTSTKTYRLIQNDWQERFLGVTRITGAKRK